MRTSRRFSKLICLILFTGVLFPHWAFALDAPHIVFERFVQQTRLQKAAEFGQRTHMHLTIVHGATSGQIDLIRTQNENQQISDEVSHQTLYPNNDMGLLRTYFQYAHGREVELSEKCRTDHQFCQSVELSPENYRISFKGLESVEGRDAYHFNLRPRQKREGLIRGDLWLDAQCALPLKLSTQAAKTNFLVKSLDVERRYSIENLLRNVSVVVSQTVAVRVRGRAVPYVATTDYTDTHSCKKTESDEEKALCSSAASGVLR